jgi:hypothetical protein
MSLCHTASDVSALITGAYSEARNAWTGGRSVWSLYEGVETGDLCDSVRGRATSTGNGSHRRLPVGKRSELIRRRPQSGLSASATGSVHYSRVIVGIRISCPL